MPAIEYFDTFAPFGSLGGPGDPWVIGVGADPLSLQAHLGQDLLLIAYPWTEGDEGSADLDMFPPFGALPDGWLDGESERITVYVAATRGRSTNNDDEPPAQYVPGRLTPINFGTRLFDGVDPLTHGGFNFGVITLIDPDGLFNGLVGYSWDNVPLIIKRGPRNTPFVDWPVVARFRSAGMLRDMDAKTIQLRDIGWQLAGPLHGETYAGSGGVEGDVDLTGRIKPWALGHCFNIEPVLLSASDQIFQWSLSSSEELIAMRHGGVDFPINADYADYAALAAAVIPAGECATCLALSLVRPNVTLQFGIRVDVIGDADEVNGHGTPLTREAIIRRVATHRGTSLLDEFSELDQSSFQRMNAYHSAPVGWYFNGDITKQAAIDLMLQGVLGWSIFTPDGRLRLGWLSAPEEQTATINLVGRVDDVGKPRLIATSSPRRGTRISWRWNYGPQPDRSSLAGGVSDEDALLYGQDAQYAPALSPALATLYPTAKLVTIDQAGFRDEADAVLEATRQQAIFSVVRNRYERQLQIDPFIDAIGIVFNVSDDPLNAPQLQICVGINATGNSSVSTFEFFA
jgi:hypothetical protein